MLQLNQQRLNEVCENVIKFTDDPSVEKDVLELLQARQTLENAYKQVTEALKKNLASSGLTSVEGDLVRISASPAGYRYKASDLKAVKPDFLELKLNMKAVEEYEKKNEKLPENVEYNSARSVAVRITIKEGTHA